MYSREMLPVKNVVSPFRNLAQNMTSCLYARKAQQHSRWNELDHICLVRYGVASTTSMKFTMGASTSTATSTTVQSGFHFCTVRLCVTRNLFRISFVTSVCASEQREVSALLCAYTVAIQLGIISNRQKIL